MPVSAPFHCTLMKKAEEEMKKYLANVVVNKPSIPIISNFVASAQNDPTKIKELLIKQIHLAEKNINLIIQQMLKL